MKSNMLDNKHSNLQGPKGNQFKRLFKQIFMPHLFWALGALSISSCYSSNNVITSYNGSHIVDGYVFNIETGQKYLL